MEANAYLEVTWGRAVKVWWSLAWRGLLFGALAGFAAGFVLGVAGAVVGMSKGAIGLLGTIAGMVVAIPVGIWVVRNVLRKSWSDFRIAFVPHDQGNT